MYDALYFVRTRAGTVWIRRQPGDADRVQLMFGDEVDGSYHSAEAAAEDAAGGHTFLVPGGLVPEDLEEWSRGPAE
jgi:hypothetical protein